MVDQPHWVERLFALGVGGKPITHKGLSSENLAQAVWGVTSRDVMRQKAAAQGRMISAEDGIANAIAIIEGVVQNRSF